MVSSPQRSNSYPGPCGDTDEHLLTALLRPGPPVGAQSQWTHLCDVTCQATAERIAQGHFNSSLFQAWGQSAEGTGGTKRWGVGGQLQCLFF